jgi:hypothetical protein
MRSPPLSLLLFAAVGTHAAEPNLLKNGSFEFPVVKGRTLNADGGNPAKVDPAETSWRKFLMLGKPTPHEGNIALGLTNEYARTGRQSIFVDFQKLTATQRRAHLLSDLLPVKAGWGYRIAVWGRIDPKRPLTKDQRRPMFRTELEFFTPDTESQSGEVEIRTEMLPGYKNKFVFVSNKWSEFITTVRVPKDAGWMKIAFRFESPREAGSTDGVVYFDDASITLLPGSEPLVPIDPAAFAKPVEDDPNDDPTADKKPAAARPPGENPPGEKPGNATEKKSE